MKKGEFYESIVRLYFRLNGYFQTGLISHSAQWGNNAAEIDVLAIRFPKHKQPERQIDFCPILTPDESHIEVVLAEVKSTSVSFNKALKSYCQLSDRNWNQILSWIGLFDSDKISCLIPLLKKDVDSDISNMNGINVPSEYGNVKIRSIIFSIEKPESTKIPKSYINGSEVIDYIWSCLCPPERREDCSTKYPINNWGVEFESIVNYFKKRNVEGLDKPSIQDIKNQFGLNDG